MCETNVCGAHTVCVRLLVMFCLYCVTLNLVMYTLVLLCVLAAHCSHSGTRECRSNILLS